MVRNTLVIVILPVILGSFSYADERTDGVDCKEFTVFAFRHAEKQKYQDNPSLTDEGQARAKRLVMLLKDKGIRQIYSTNYRRTIETVTPLSETLGIPIAPYDPRELVILAGDVVASEMNTVVVGHSNTTPDLVKLLSGETVEPIDESQYDHLFAVSFCGNKPTELAIETSSK